jgi:NAD(P)H-binding
MKIFVAGATGVLGRELVPQLVARGHEVVGITRSASKQDLVRSLGARPVVADALDPDAVAQAVASAEPEVIVHQLTALSGKLSARDMRHPERSPMAIMTNRLRTEGTDHLLAAGRAVGARRFVAQSFAAFRWARTGGPVQTEADPLDPNPPAALRAPLLGILHMERAVTAIEWGEGLVLRYAAASTVPGPRSAWLRTRNWRRRSASVGSQSSATVLASGRTSTSTTPRPRPSPRSTTASQASTTSSTTSPHRCGSGCRCWRARWMQETATYPTLAGAAGRR